MAKIGRTDKTQYPGRSTATRDAHALRMERIATAASESCLAASGPDSQIPAGPADLLLDVKPTGTSTFVHQKIRIRIFIAVHSEQIKIGGNPNAEERIT